LRPRSTHACISNVLNRATCAHRPRGGQGHHSGQAGHFAYSQVYLVVYPLGALLGVRDLLNLSITPVVCVTGGWDGGYHKSEKPVGVCPGLAANVADLVFDRWPRRSCHERLFFSLPHYPQNRHHGRDSLGAGNAACRRRTCSSWTSRCRTSSWRRPDTKKGRVDFEKLELNGA